MPPLPGTVWVPPVLPPSELPPFWIPRLVLVEPVEDDVDDVEEVSRVRLGILVPVIGSGVVWLAIVWAVLR